ncbi:hypothetical protein ABPG72_006206 [Tetrahymena utriculariae]
MIENISQKCKDVFLQSDIYGQSVIIHLGKKKQHQTYIGSCFTFLTAIIMGVALFYLMKEFIQKSDPTVISLEAMINDGKDYLDQIKKIKFGIQFFDKSGNLITEQYQLQKIQKSISFKLCSEENYTKCINIPTSDGSLDNTQEGLNYKYIFPNLSQVNFEQFLLQNINKLSQWTLQIFIEQNIQSQSQAKFWQITCLDSYVNIQNYEDPVQTFQRNYFMYLYENKTHYQFDFLNVNIQTDRGMMYEDITEQEYLILKDTSFSTLSNDYPYAQFVEVILDRKQKVVKRSYLKIQSILTQIGGLIKIVVLFFQFVSSPLIKLSLQLELVNSVFQFEDEENIVDENQQNKSKNSKNVDDKADSIIYNGNSNKNQQHQNGVTEFSRNRFFNLTLKLNKNLNIPKEFQNTTNQKTIEECLNKKNSNTEIEQIEQNNSHNSTVNAQKKNSIFKLDQFQSVNLAQAADNKQIPQIPIQKQQNKLKNNKHDNSLKSMNCSDCLFAPKEPFKESNNQNAIQNLINLSQNQNQVVDGSLFSPKTQRNKSHSLFQQNHLSSNGLQTNLQMIKISEIASKAKLIKKLVHQKLTKLSMRNSSQPDSPLQSVEMEQARDMVKGKKNEGFNSIFIKLFKNVTHNYLVMKFLDKIKYLLKIKFNKQQQLKFSMDKISERLDIIFIIKKIVEIDKLKMILFDQNQLKIFEYLPRPIIKFDPYTIEENDKLKLEQKTVKNLERLKNPNNSVQENNYSDDANNVHELWQHALIESDKPYFQKVHEAAKAYEYLSKKESKDVYDMRLLQFLDNQRRDYFEEMLRPSSPSVHSQNQKLQDFINKRNPFGNEPILDQIPENQFSNKQVTLQNVNIPVNGSLILGKSLNQNQTGVQPNFDKQISLNQDLQQNNFKSQECYQNNLIALNQNDVKQKDTIELSQLQISINQSEDISEGQQRYQPTIQQIDFMDQINKFLQQTEEKNKL